MQILHNSLTSELQEKQITTSVIDMLTVITQNAAFLQHKNMMGYAYQD